MRASLIAVRTGLVTGLIALSLMSFSTAPGYAGTKTPKQTETINSCNIDADVCINNGCNGPGGSQGTPCIDACMAKASKCMSKARIDVIGSETTIGGGGAAVQTP